MEKEFKRLLEQLISRGATYADIRIMDRKWESLLMKNGQLERNTESESAGFGVRVLYDGAWGFACSFDLTPEEYHRISNEALRIAKGAAGSGKEKVKLAAQEPVHGTWRSPFKLDPFI